MCNVVMKNITHYNCVMFFIKKMMFFLHIQCYNGFILEYEKSTPGSSFTFYKEADEQNTNRAFVLTNMTLARW